MRSLCVLLIALATTACGGGTSALFREYEYEEEMYLSLDGSATMFVNSSIAALNALRGTSFDARVTARLDRGAVRRHFTTPATRVIRVSTSRRSGRQFVHVRLEVEDVGRLGETAPFGWSSYRLAHEGGRIVYEQTIGPPPGAPPSDSAKAAGWAGDELTAFRIHVPSVVVYHNAGPGNPRRGNILVWEQPLAERLQGVPVQLEARMESRSILYTTLFLFAGMFTVVVVMFAFIVWWIVRKGRKHVR